jgi:hypothetical protein
MSRMTAALLALGAMFVVLLFIVAGNDAGTRAEIASLQGTLARTHATDAQCDAMYHAIWRVKQEPSHSTLVQIAVALDCPFENE